MNTTTNNFEIPLVFEVTPEDLKDGELRCTITAQCAEAEKFCVAAVQHNFMNGTCNKNATLFCNTNCIFTNAITFDLVSVE
jgi:hypothetical protein